MAHTNEEHTIIMQSETVKGLDISRTTSGEANFIQFQNALRPDGCPGGTIDAGDFVAALWDSSWIVKKVTYDF